MIEPSHSLYRRSKGFNQSRNLSSLLAQVLTERIASGGQTITDSATWNLTADNAQNMYVAAGQLTSGFVSNDTLLGAHKYGSDNFFRGGTPTTGRRQCRRMSIHQTHAICNHMNRHTSLATTKTPTVFS
ncbi:hypothetical protein [Pseudomonas sp. R5(2019)]|uniref:hypothetical protein n=1 Tax=Pseudomonas sp. R5(2019) TaxID=2697566 RepID=UPI0015B50BA8|nr:hypothetical protein [Pseudomonas sp. R5(2019)]